MTNFFNRMGWVLAALVSLVALAAMAGMVVAGPLDPPGPVGPTMKTLDQVEARTPIAQANIPFVISTPGSYYLTGNISYAGTPSDAISIVTSDVTLDLNGFRVQGTGAALSTGIYAGADRIVIRNGVVRSYTNDILVAASDLLIEDVEVGLALNAGIALGNTSASAQIVRSVFAENRHGLDAVGSLSATVRDSVFRENTDYGARLSSRADITGSMFIGNNADGGTGAGIIIIGDHNRIEGNSITDTNAANGIYVLGGNGNAIIDNLVSGNGGDGITIDGDRNRVSGNTVDSNGALYSGIATLSTADENQIDGNTATNNNFGFFIYGTGQVVYHNTSSGNTTANYDIGGGPHDVGPLGSIGGGGFDTWGNIDN